MNKFFIFQDFIDVTKHECIHTVILILKDILMIKIFNLLY